MPPRSTITFRQATAADIPAMSRIRLSVTENVLSDPRRVTIEMYVDFLENSGRGWVAEHHEHVVGFCYADKINGAIWALFVRPGHEGQGLATSLLEMAAHWLFDVGHQRIHLSTGSDTRADRFYAARGWTRSPVSLSEVAYTLTKPAPVPAAT